MAAVWAYSLNVPGKTCEDAKLLGEGTKLQYPAGNDRGQAGWDVGVAFSNFGELSGALRDIRSNTSISRLAINVHGSPGEIDADGNKSAYGFDRLWDRYSSQLVFMNVLLNAGAPVLIMGCNVAKGIVGATFLMDLSRKAFPARDVTAFTTVGETLRQFRRGEGCTEPGMRDTPYENNSFGMPEVQKAREKEVLTLPWASEYSPHALVARDGKLVKLGGKTLSEDERQTLLTPPQSDFSMDNYLPGTWNASAGCWKGYFVFKKDKSAYWMTELQGPIHRGKWWTSPGSIVWEFEDDPRGWKRRIEMYTPLKSTMTASVTINGKNHGAFSMSKLS